MFPDVPGLHVEERASHWPDVMFCGGRPPSCFFSRKVIESLDAHGIAVKRLTPIPVGKFGEGKLKSVPLPDYFVIEAIPGIRIDYAASGFVVDADGNPVPGAPIPKPPPTTQYDPATWSGLDLFCVSNGRAGGPYYLELLCTERVKEIAKQDGWTDVSFDRLYVKGINPFTGKPD